MFGAILGVFRGTFAAKLTGTDDADLGCDAGMHQPACAELQS